jgi:hypothetical protein
MSSSSLPGIQKSFIKDAEHRARARVALTVIAIERFRLENENRLPDGLAALAPKYLAAVPLDPFDGRPLRFRRLSMGYMVYSIGTDELDDEGAEPPLIKRSLFPPPSRFRGGLVPVPNSPRQPRDITFIVARQGIHDAF